MDRDVRSQLPHCFSVGNWACGAPGRPGNRLSKRRYSDNYFYTSCVRIEAFMVNISVQSFHDLIVRSVSYSRRSRLQLIIVFQSFVSVDGLRP